MKKVSIIIPCYNYGKYIEETIESCLNSTYSDFDIIVVDDGSTDLFTLNVLKNLEHRDTRIKVLSKKNGGLSSARNFGINYSQAQYILTLDSDDKIAPTFIEKAVWILENKSQIGYVFPLVQLFEEEDGIWETKATGLKYLKYRNTVPATIVMRKSCWEDIDGYNEKMKDGYEDWEFIIRMEKKGFKGFHLNEVLFYYRKHNGSMLGDSKKKHRHLIKTIRSIHGDLYNKDLVDKTLYYCFEIKNIIKKKGQVLKKKILENKHLRKIMKKMFYKLKPIKYDDIVNGKTRSLIGKDILIKRPKVLIVLPWLNVGGVENVFLNLISSLNDSVDFFVVTTKPQIYHPLEEHFRNKKVQVHQIGGLSKQDQIEFIHYLISKNNVSTVHLSNSQRGYEILSYIRNEFPNIQIIDTLHMEEPWNEWDYFRLSKKYSNLIDERIVLTETQKVTLLEMDKKVERHSVKVIPNGIDLSKYKYKSDRKESKDFFIGFVSRMVYQKNPVFFVEIVKESKKKGFPFKFIMVGEGELLREVKKLVKKNNLDNNIEFYPFTKNINELLNKIDIVICPSYLEGFPMLGLEAMAKGVPIVATDVGGWNDLIENNYNGFLLELDVNKFLKTIDILFRDIDLYETIKVNARNTVLKYNYEEMGKSYFTVYNEGLK